MAKGAGKSAIYALVNRREDELFDKNILLVSAENPRGTTVFSDLVAEPPPSEPAFVVMWKLYFVVLAAQKMKEFGLLDKRGQNFVKVLEGAGLLVPTGSPSTIFRAVMKYIGNWLNRDVESVEHAVSYDPATSIPTITRKTNLRPRSEERRVSDIPVDNLLRDANLTLAASRFKIWIVLD